MYEVDRGIAKAFITAVFAFYASGMICPPMLLYSYKEYYLKSQRVPDGWSMTITYKMFEEFMGSELETDLKIREGKMKQNLHSRARLMHYKKHHQKS